MKDIQEPLRALRPGCYVLANSSDSGKQLLPTSGDDPVPVSRVDDFSRNSKRAIQGIYIGSPVLNEKSRAVTFL